VQPGASDAESPSLLGKANRGVQIAEPSSEAHTRSGKPGVAFSLPSERLREKQAANEKLMNFALHELTADQRNAVFYRLTESEVEAVLDELIKMRAEPKAAVHQFLMQRLGGLTIDRMT